MTKHNKAFFMRVISGNRSKYSGTALKTRQKIAGCAYENFNSIQAKKLPIKKRLSYAWGHCKFPTKKRMKRRK